MRDPLETMKSWGRNAFLRLRALEEAMEYRYQDYAQARFERLERRVTSLEQGRGGLHRGTGPRRSPEAGSDPR